MEDIKNTDVQILGFAEDEGKMTLRNRLSGADCKPPPSRSCVEEPTKVAGFYFSFNQGTVTIYKCKLKLRKQDQALPGLIYVYLFIAFYWSGLVWYVHKSSLQFFSRVHN